MGWLARLFEWFEAPQAEKRKLETFYQHFSEVPIDLWRWPNFTPEEIACKGSGMLMLDFDALDKLQKARDIYGKPMKINSAYRSPSHNKAVGGGLMSEHKNGRAFDIKANHGTKYRKKLIAALREAGFTGFGYYRTFVHADSGRPRFWGAKWKDA